MSKPIENCPAEEKPIRERAWTAEQVERAAEQLCVRSRDDLDAERMLRDYAATLRQQTTNSAASSSKLAGQQGEQAGGVVSDEAVSVFRDAYIEAYDNAASVSYAPVDNGCIEIALEAVAPLLRAPAERGESVDVARWLAVDAQSVANEVSPRHIQSVIEDMQCAIRELSGNSGQFVQEELLTPVAHDALSRAVHAFDGWDGGDVVPGDRKFREYMREALRAALAQNAQTLGDFVRLPDAEREAIGQEVVERAIEMQNAQGEAVYQAMCTDPNIDEDGNSHEDDGCVWMDVTKADYESLSKRPDIRSRVVYLHAERARVPDTCRETIQEAIDLLADVAQFKGNLKIDTYRHIGQKLSNLLAAALPQRADDHRDMLLGEMKRRACIAHTLCYELSLRYPEIPELGDDGKLHCAIHDVLAVDTPSAKVSGTLPGGAAAPSQPEDAA